MTTHHTNERGIGLIELIIVGAISLVIVAVAVPSVITTRRNYRIAGDAREVGSVILLAKMRAAASFTQSRVYADLAGRTFRIEVWDKASNSWTTEGGEQLLQPGVGFATAAELAVLSTPPPTTQSTLAQASACLDNTGTAIANTACMLFNSRGIPINSAGAPTANHAFYVTDGVAVFGTTISATGLTRTWRTEAATANWQRR